MKTMLLLACLIACCLNSNGQYLSASEMIEQSNCKSFDCFNKFIRTKHFSFSSTDNSASMGIYCLYLSDSYETDIDSRLQLKTVTLFSLSKSRVGVGFRTANRSYFIKLMKEFKSKGFKQSVINNHRETNHEKSIDIDYVSEMYPNLVLMVRYDWLEVQGVTFNSYDFELSNSY